jgi:5-formyltetrahydrofolate cyclo-ligase
MSKQDKRQDFLIRRSNVSARDKMRSEDRIIELLKHDPDLTKAHSIAGYAAIRKELSVTEYLHWALKHNKQVFLPRCNGKTYEMVEITDMNRDLTEGHYGILEPKKSLPALKPGTGYPEISAWIVPGVAFNSEGMRLGMGKGIYDRLLAGSSAVKVGVGFECQRTDDIPTDPWDIPLDKVYFV